MNLPQISHEAWYSRPADWLLVVAPGVLAFVLGCYQLFDTDVWWHLRSGQWILENRRVPQLDIFTFSSGNRVWIVLHWGFQVAVALAHAVGEVPGMILLAATASSAAVVIALLSREQDWPLWVAAFCWLPALALLSTRFDPRPEVFSLVYLACFLAILLRVERRPALAWALSPLQVLWVNSHGLFILGPIVLGFYLVDRSANALSNSIRSTIDQTREMRRCWRHLAPAAVAVALACLANPYGLRGAIFPLELLPKISDPANPYKSYIDEFTSLQTATRNRVLVMPGIHFHLRTHIFLLLLIPWTFVLPAAWRGWRLSHDRGGRVGDATMPWWIAGWIFACGLALLPALGMPSGQTGAWLMQIGRAQPATLLVLGETCAALLALRSRMASAIVAVGTVAIAAWGAWLRVYLFELGSELPGILVTTLPYLAAVLGALTAALAVRLGASLFRLLLAAAFTYLSFQAVRNINLFGLVIGAVLGWNMSEWVAALAAGRPPSRLCHIGARAVRTLLIGLVVLWAVAVVTDRYYSLTGENIHFGLRERPLTFAHDAVRFAGRPGMPARALVYGLGQTGVYVYHNGPDRKVFMDARLEVPSLATFQTYVRIERWLNENDSRWDAAISRLGDPLILIGHEGASDAEASLLTHPRWRCLYFDAIASVFVPRHGVSSAPNYADFDFAASHFAGASERAAPDERQRLAAEAAALLRLGTVLRKRGGDPWRWRIPVLMRASDLIREVRPGHVADPTAWRTLGLIEWEKVPDLTRSPPGPDDPWDPATCLPWARATYCFRRALAAASADFATRRALAECYRVRGMARPQREVELLPAGKGLTADRVALQAEYPAPPPVTTWSRANRIAVTHLHLGDPDSARRVLAEVNDPPSQALRLTRMAGADLSALDSAAALANCRMALELDPTLGEAWYVLATALVESGRADLALAAVRESVKRPLTAPERTALTGVEALLHRSHPKTQ